MVSPEPMPDPSIDTPLIERVRHSDPEAFRLLFERYQPILFKQLLVRTREIEVAHDCVQETFLRALTRQKVSATLRCEKGHDIDAACGQLRLRTERELATRV